MESQGRKSMTMRWLLIRQMFDPLAVFYLTLWFIANIAITLFSKALFREFHFPYPMLLTAIHLLFTWVMSVAAAQFRVYNAQTLTVAMFKKTFLFSFVFTTNIWLSNFSLMYASINVHQVVRTTIPLFTMFFSYALFSETYPFALVPSVLLVVAGVAITVWGDLDLTTFGVVIALLGCAFSSIKGIMTKRAQIDMETFDVLRCVCPLSVMQLVVCASLTGEASKAWANRQQFSWGILASQGVLAAALNFVSFKCAHLNSPLTMNIAGNIKQVVTPLVSLAFLPTIITLLGYVGMGITLVGALWYGWDVNRLRQLAKTPPATPPPATPSPEENIQPDFVEVAMANAK